VLSTRKELDKVLQQQAIAAMQRSGGRVSRGQWGVGGGAPKAAALLTFFQKICTF